MGRQTGGTRVLRTVGGRAGFPPSSLSRGASWLGDSCPGSQLRGRPAGAQCPLIREGLPGLFLCHCLQPVASCYVPSNRDPSRPLPCPGSYTRCWAYAGGTSRSQSAYHTPKAAASLCIVCPRCRVTPSPERLEKLHSQTGKLRLKESTSLPKTAELCLDPQIPGRLECFVPPNNSLYFVCFRSPSVKWKPCCLELLGG